MKIIDSSIWIAYFQGQEEVKGLIEHEKLGTSAIALAEIASKFDRAGLKFEKEFLFIQSRSKIIPLTAEMALVAAKLKNKQRKKQGKFGLADAMMYATAQVEKGVLVTADRDFLGLEHVEIVF